MKKNMSATKGNVSGARYVGPSKFATVASVVECGEFHALRKGSGPTLGQAFEEFREVIVIMLLENFLWDQCVSPLLPGNL